jgi:hypothetical protein
MKRIFVLFLSFILAALQLSFGQNIDPTVEVSGQYDVRLNDIHKPVIPTEVTDTLQRFDVSFDYSIFNRPFKDLYEFSPYEAAQLKTIGQQSYPFLYARLGCQYPLMPSAELQVQAVAKSNLYFGVSANHDSFWGDVHSALNDDVSLSRDKMKNGAGVNMKYAWKTGEFLLAADYDHAIYDYEYDDKWSQVNDWYCHKNDNLSVRANILSANKAENSIYYDFTGVFSNMRNRRNLSGSEYVSRQDESYASFGGYVGTTFDRHRVYLDMSVDFAFYDEPKNYNTGIVEFSPIYEYKKGRFFGKFGVKFGNSFGTNKEEESTITTDGNDVSASSSIFPDIDARYEVVSKALWLHLKAEGGNDMNDMISMVRKVPFVLPTTALRFGKRPLDASFAIESAIGGRLSVNLISTYTIFKNRRIFTPMSFDGETIFANYKDMNSFSIGAEAFWKSEDVTTGAEFRYFSNKADGEAVLELPDFTGKFYFRYDWRERIVASLDLNYRSALEYYSVPAIFDLGVSLTLNVNKHLGIFLKGGNLLDMRNQYVPYYVEPGRNFGCGVTLTL